MKTGLCPNASTTARRGESPTLSYRTHFLYHCQHGTVVFPPLGILCAMHCIRLRLSTHASSRAHASHKLRLEPQQHGLQTRSASAMHELTTSQQDVHLRAEQPCSQAASRCSYPLLHRHSKCLLLLHTLRTACRPVRVYCHLP